MNEAYFARTRLPQDAPARQTQQPGVDRAYLRIVLPGGPLVLFDSAEVRGVIASGGYNLIGNSFGSSGWMSAGVPRDLLVNAELEQWHSARGARGKLRAARNENERGDFL